MRAYILSIGNELMLGHLTDTNATFLAQELASLGVDLLNVTQVGDDRWRLATAISHACHDADLVVCTGGVGPTEDDLTREAIADVVGQSPNVDPVLVASIRAFFAGRGLPMPDRNAKQAWIIPASESLPNLVGTAPGWFVRHDDTVIVAMPGVPREMFRMWREQVVPRLRHILPERYVRSITLKTLGIGESAVEELLHDLVARDQPVVATYAKDDGVHVRLTSFGTSEDEALAVIEPVLREVRHRLREYIYTDNESALAGVLVTAFRSRNATLAVGEEGTGGIFTSLLMSDDSCSNVVLGSLITAVCGPPSSAETVANDVRERFHSSCGVGLVAQTEQVGNGLVNATIHIAASGMVNARHSFPLIATHVEVQRRASLHAADVLLRALRTETTHRLS